MKISYNINVSVYELIATVEVWEWISNSIIWYVLGFCDTESSRWHNVNNIAADALVPGVGRSPAMAVTMEDKKWVNEWTHWSAFLERTVDIKVHVIRISRVIIICTLEWLSSLTEIARNLQVTINFKK